MKTSISGRLTAMFAVLMIAILAILGVFLRTSLFTSLENLMHNELTFRSTLMAPFISSQGTVGNWNHVERKLATLADNESGKVNYLIISKNKKFNLGDSDELPISYDHLKEGFSRLPTRGNEYPWYILVKTIKPLGERPEIKFSVTINSKPYYNTLNEFTRSLVFICIAGLIMVIVLSDFISRLGLRPARKLSNQANGLPLGELWRRLDTDTLPKELYSLATAFNGVLERREGAWNQLESFNANVAHELRTPLTNLIGQTQLGLSRQRSAEQLEELLQSNLEEFERMTSIVNDMLFLSHAQSGQRVTELTVVSLREEIIKTGEYVEPLLSEKNLTLEVNGDITTCIDKRLFHRALANLLENAARHSLTCRIISVTLSESAEFVHIDVTNYGESIEEEHLSRLFERFYRVDASRNLSSVHHGLGLAIVKAVASMHDGQVYAFSNQGVNTFGFTLKSELRC